MSTLTEKTTTDKVSEQISTDPTTSESTIEELSKVDSTDVTESIITCT